MEINFTTVRKIEEIMKEEGMPISFDADFGRANTLNNLLKLYKNNIITFDEVQEYAEYMYEGTSKYFPKRINKIEERNKYLESKEGAEYINKTYGTTIHPETYNRLTGEYYNNSSK